ncbi:MAG: hypothetical protein WCA83_08750 [Azonexus sp.]
MNIRHSLVALLAAFLTHGLQAADNKPQDNSPKLAYGQLMKYDGKLLFSPCRDPSYSTMEDVSQDRAVTKALNSVGLEAGKKLYVELLAVIEGGVIKASAVNQARTEGHCQLPGGNRESWRAAGKEPGWLLAIGNESVALKREGKPDVMTPYAPPTSEGGVTKFKLVTESAKLAIQFDNVLCHDAAANSVFGWTATVEVGGQTLKGCAWQR